MAILISVVILRALVLALLPALVLDALLAHLDPSINDNKRVGD